MRRRDFAVALGMAGLAADAAGAMAHDDARRKELYALLGDTPPRNRPISAVVTGHEERAGYEIEKLTLDLNGLEPVPAYFLKPKAGAGGRRPTILYNHSHGGGYTIGKKELLDGREYIAKPPYADFLTGLGYNVLCIDTWCFGERSARTELDTFKLMLWEGRVLWGMMVYDSLRAMDYLMTRADVDTARVATVGMSMGSSMAQWTAALDERIRVCVDICDLTDYQALIAANGLHVHGVYYFVPSLLKHFTASQINALIAPRPHLGLAGDLDKITPVAGLERIDAELRQVYQAAGSADRWKLLRFQCAHQELPEMREQVKDFLVKHV